MAAPAPLAALIRSVVFVQAIDMQTNQPLRDPDAPIGRGDGSGFFGCQWQEEPGSGAVLMCDSYVMTAPTFPMHPHRHMSAVAILFEDTVGRMVSSDSVGTNHRFGAGDVHWTLAGSGVTHTQTPEPGARIHAVQMFIDLPDPLRRSPAQTFHLRAEDVPVHETAHCRLRLLVGQAFGRCSPLPIPQDILVVEGWSDAAMEMPVPEGWKIWLYDRVNERAGYADDPVVEGRFLMVASPL